MILYDNDILPRVIIECIMYVCGRYKGIKVQSIVIFSSIHNAKDRKIKPSNRNYFLQKYLNN